MSEFQELLHVFCMGDTDYVVARDTEDAWAVLVDHGYDRSDYEGDELAEMPDTGTLSILCDAEGNLSDAGVGLRLTFGEWANREGRGFLCSTEY